MRVFFTTLLISPALCGVSFVLAILFRDIFITGLASSSISLSNFIVTFFGTIFFSYLFVFIFWQLSVMLLIYAAVYSIAFHWVNKQNFLHSLRQRYLVNSIISALVGLLVYYSGFNLAAKLRHSEAWLIVVTTPVCIIVGLLTTNLTKPYNKALKQGRA